MTTYTKKATRTCIVRIRHKHQFRRLFCSERRKKKRWETRPRRPKSNPQVRRGSDFFFLKFGSYEQVAPGLLRVFFFFFAAVKVNKTSAQQLFTRTPLRFRFAGGGLLLLLHPGNVSKFLITRPAHTHTLVRVYVHTAYSLWSYYTYYIVQTPAELFRGKTAAAAVLQ